MKVDVRCRHCLKKCFAEVKSCGRQKQYTCTICGGQWSIDTYGSRKEFSIKMQKVAIRRIYRQVWPSYSIVEVDTLPSELAKRLDIGGIDKVLFANDGHIIQIAQRFRESDVWENPRRRDFTIREAEMKRHLAALRNGGAVPTFYSYGYASEDEEDFRQLYIVKYYEWLQGIGEAHRPRFIRPKKRGQEGFYYESWASVPNEYIVFTYPTNVQQLILF